MLLVAHCLGVNSQAQNWVAVDTAFNIYDEAKFMYVDTVEDRLYLGGEFYDNGAQITGVLQYYDGYNLYNLDTFSPPRLGSGGSRSMFRYQNKLYVGGWFKQIGKNKAVSHSIAQLQNDTFITVNTIPTILSSGNVTSMVEYRGQLILGFEGDSLAGIRSRGIVSYDGSTFGPMGGGVLDEYSATIVNSVAVYKNRLYAAGNFYTRKNGVMDQTTRNFQVWDDNKKVWTTVDGWKGSQNSSSVNDLLEFQNDLYIMGGFSTTDSALANDLVRFDGTYFYSVGKGAGLYFINKATVYKSELYVCGLFDEMDGIQANGIAKWNGTRWCSLSNDVFTRTGNIYGVHDIAFYHDTLFAYGGFMKISGKEIKVLAKWVGNSSMTGSCASPANQDTVNYNLSVVSETKANMDFKVYPNPSKGNITIETNEFNSKKQVQLIDQAGKVLIWGSINSTVSEMDLKGLEPGIYFLKLEGMGTQKIIKE